ncbi:unnamed protein product [Dibothriocephalus latus]|uniref:Uncharacterized protein n=1 Tax=Dibothriocephalus latus TaxID=60516 RepID=A0A3P7L2A8_DIBLA|nr:unnamed protein product [Dibothriocephalus latus]
MIPSLSFLRRQQGLATYVLHRNPPTIHSGATAKKLKVPRFIVPLKNKTVIAPTELTDGEDLKNVGRVTTSCIVSKAAAHFWRWCIADWRSAGEQASFTSVTESDFSTEEELEWNNHADADISTNRCKITVEYNEDFDMAEPIPPLRIISSKAFLSIQPACGDANIHATINKAIPPPTLYTEVLCACSSSREATSTEDWRNPQIEYETTSSASISTAESSESETDDSDSYASADEGKSVLESAESPIPRVGSSPTRMTVKLLVQLWESKNVQAKASFHQRGAPLVGIPTKAAQSVASCSSN